MKHFRWAESPHKQNTVESVEELQYIVSAAKLNTANP